MDEYINKEVKVSLQNQIYYRGKVLSAGEDYIKIRDIKDKIVFINLKNIISMEVIE
jgi:small nuclear ribonucleoprotein (snRNP)-like protein